jgi:hypothetical protein
MQKCCKNRFTICEDYIGCPSELFVIVPPNYFLSDIYMRVTKSSGVSFYCTSIVEDGIAEIPIGDAPEGFFNPFGSHYLLEFFEYSAEAPLVEFSVNSQIYDGIEFGFSQGIGLTDIITINIF